MTEASSQHVHHPDVPYALGESEPVIDSDADFFSQMQTLHTKITRLPPTKGVRIAHIHELTATQPEEQKLLLTTSLTASAKNKQRMLTLGSTLLQNFSVLPSAMSALSGFAQQVAAFCPHCVSVIGSVATQGVGLPGMGIPHMHSDGTLHTGDHMAHESHEDHQTPHKTEQPHKTRITHHSKETATSFAIHHVGVGAFIAGLLFPQRTRAQIWAYTPPKFTLKQSATKAVSPQTHAHLHV